MAAIAIRAAAPRRLIRPRRSAINTRPWRASTTTTSSSRPATSSPRSAAASKRSPTANPSAKIIRMGIGDVTEPLPPAVVEAMHKAVDEMGRRETFRGYGPEQGYDFLREAIAKNDFQARGCDIAADEIFVSDGSKCDGGNILDIFGPAHEDNTIAVTDPGLPGLRRHQRDGRPHRRGGRERRVPGPGLPPRHRREQLHAGDPEAEGRHHLPLLSRTTRPAPSRRASADAVGRVREGERRGHLLRRRVRGVHHRRERSRTRSTRSPAARDVAIEFRSFSKTAGFTGVRCAFTVVPKSAQRPARRDGSTRRRCTSSGRAGTRRSSTASPTSSSAAPRRSTPTPASSRCSKLVAFYLDNAKLIREGLAAIGLQSVRRRQRAVRLGQDARQHDELGLLRPAAEQGERRRHARQRLRHQRRRLLPRQRLQQPRERQRALQRIRRASSGN